MRIAYSARFTLHMTWIRTYSRWMYSLNRLNVNRIAPHIQHVGTHSIAPVRVLNNNPPLVFLCAQLCGYSVSLTAFSLYTYYKIRDQRQATVASRESGRWLWGVWLGVVCGGLLSYVLLVCSCVALSLRILIVFYCFGGRISLWRLWNVSRRDVVSCGVYCEKKIELFYALSQVFV